jgi:TonB family protein
MADQNDQSGDRLLWLAAGVVALMGLAWLIVAAPWSSPDAEQLEDIAVAPVGVVSDPLEAQAAPAAAAPRRTDPLHTARMALDAGMLIEPAEYSAWTLFGRVVASEPDNESARDGLEQVAAALLQRADTALEQGRFEDAAEIAATITERIPDHPGATALAAEVVRAMTPPEPVRIPETRKPPVVAQQPETVDPIPDMHDAFLNAMAQNAVLRPAGTSAIDIVNDMLATASDHELTIAARDMLVTEMLDRSAQSLEALDVRAAQTWIDSAATLSVDSAQVDRAQDRLTQHLIDAESQQMLPASDLNQVRFVAAEFPRIALDRGIEGWVELEFVVSPTGETENLTVIDASHERFFRDEAIAAVKEWRFEPVVFMGQAIPKRAYTRLAFVLD